MQCGFYSDGVDEGIAEAADEKTVTRKISYCNIHCYAIAIKFPPDYDFQVRMSQRLRVAEAGMIAEAADEGCCRKQQTKDCHQT